MQQRYYLSAFTAFLIWGFMPLIIRHLENYPIGVILYFRILLASLLLIFAGIFILPNKWRDSYAQFQKNTKVEKQKIIGITIFSSFLLMLNWGLYVYVVNYVNAQASAFAYILCPILTAILGFVILKEKLAKHQWFAIGLCIISCGLMATGTLRSFLYSLIVGGIYALYLVIQRLTKDYDKIVLLTLQLLLAAIFVLPCYSLIQEPNQAALDTNFFGLAIILSLFFTVIPLFLNLYALKNLPSATVGVFMYMNPLTGFMLAFFYFGEKTTPIQLWAYLLIFIAVIFYNLPLGKKN